MKLYTSEQTDYLLRIKKSAAQLKISSEAVIEDMQEIQSCLAKDSEVWPGIPNATVFAAATRAAAEIDTLLGMRRHFFPRPSVDASSEDKAANMKFVSEAIGEALEGF
jgi:hypothetical protein